MKPFGKEQLLPKNKKENRLRLQVFLSHNGVCSRREAMKIIQDGQVKLNGLLVKEPSTPVNPLVDRVEVNGKLIENKSYTYVMLNKPKGHVTTTEDPHADKTVLELLPANLRHLNPVGRLDRATEGLLILTNDGEIAYRLTHPKFNVDKTYFVRIRGALSPQEQKRLEKGVMVEGKMTAPAAIKVLRSARLAEGSPRQTGAHCEFFMTIHEGRKRQIRLMLEEVGHRVVYLKRTVQGPLQLKNLETGKWRFLEPKEIQALKRISG